MTSSLNLFGKKSKLISARLRHFTYVFLPFPRKGPPIFSCVFSSCFLRGQDAGWGCQYHETRQTAWQQILLFIDLSAAQIWAEHSTFLFPPVSAQAFFWVWNHRWFQIHQCNDIPSWQSEMRLCRTLAHGLIRTWYLSFFSVLLMLLKTSARTFMCNMMAPCKCRKILQIKTDF